MSSHGVLTPDSVRIQVFPLQGWRRVLLKRGLKVGTQAAMMPTVASTLLKTNVRKKLACVIENVGMG